jgi:hypothetical protein
MAEIKYMEKPDWVTWEDVLACIHEAHKVNKKKGFTMTGYDMTMERFMKKLGDGKCFVALDGDKLIGVTTVRFIKSRRWCAWGKRVAYNGLDGILKAYQGTDVFPSLNALRYKCIEDNGVDIVEFNTAEHNKVVIKRNLQLGAKKVQYAHARLAKDKYHSIVMMRWLHGCPYPDWLCNFMFWLSKVVIKLSEIGKRN